MYGKIQWVKYITMHSVTLNQISTRKSMSTVHDIKFHKFNLLHLLCTTLLHHPFAPPFCTTLLHHSFAPLIKKNDSWNIHSFNSKFIIENFKPLNKTNCLLWVHKFKWQMTVEKSKHLRFHIHRYCMRKPKIIISPIHTMICNFFLFGMQPNFDHFFFRVNSKKKMFLFCTKGDTGF